MKILSISAALLFFISTASFEIQAETRLFFSEEEFSQALNGAGYNIFKEDFEGPAWDSVRSSISKVNAAKSVSNNEIEWTSTDRVTTGEHAGRTGYGLYSHEHGVPDALFGVSAKPLYAAGGWIRSNTPPAEINFILDSTKIVDFDDPIVSTDFRFFGLIDSSGFEQFEIREIEGEVGDLKFIFIDDFTFAGTAATANLPPSADAGPDFAVAEGETVFLDGSGSVDPENTTLALFWEQKSGPTAILSDPSAVKPSFVAPKAGPGGDLLIFTLTATDDDGLEDVSGVVVYLERGPALYFPYVVSSGGWETEIGLVNKTDNQTFDAVLSGYDKAGNRTAEKSIGLAPRARAEIAVEQEFANPESIAYLVCYVDPANVAGYAVYSSEGTYRAAVPASSRINRHDIRIAHIASLPDAWWTGIALLNVASQAREIALELDGGGKVQFELSPGEQTFFRIEDLFGGQSKPAIRSGLVRDAAGIVGVEIFGTAAVAQTAFGASYLAGVEISDRSFSRLYYPHIASDDLWSTGIVAYNPTSANCELNISPYDSSGTPLGPVELVLDSRLQHIGTIDNLGFDTNSAWFRIDAGCKIDALEIFSRRDGLSGAGFRAFDAGKSEGLFPRLDKTGATGIALVNTEGFHAYAKLSAYDDSGAMVSESTTPLGPFEKVAGLAEQFFETDISKATYIVYESDRPLAGFVLNMSSDGRMLDGLPGM